MPQIRPSEQLAEDLAHTLYAKRAGTAPLPGYVLLEPLGRGGFGEVWKCEVPGGLHKAIKFVAGGPGRDETLLRQEYEAFQQVKAIRHPFLLCLERVELVGDELIMVMGLADRHIGERYHECASAGQPGIPRAELIGYMREAAEALDVIGERYGLQHLDVKPANLFLTAGHVQVGDYGLVSKLDRGEGGKNRGITPKYGAPEVLCGAVHTRSDQYSLALVYQEMLTGTFPFAGRTSAQIMLQHMSGTPDLSGLPESDRAAIAVALAKRPDDRFPSCRELIDALAAATPATPRAGRVVPGRGSDVTPAPVATPAPSVPPTRGPAPDETTPGSTPAPRLPRLIATKRSAPIPVAAPLPPPAPVPPTPAPAQADDPLKPTGVKLPFVLSVTPVGWLRGREAPDPDLEPDEMVRAILVAAKSTAPPDPAPGATDGTWSRRFLTTVDPRIARVKLDTLWEQDPGLSMTGSRNEVVFRHVFPAASGTSGLFGGFTKKAPPPPSGYEVTVQLPEAGGAVRDVVVTGRLFGSPTSEQARDAAKPIVALLDGVCDILGNHRERRKHPRIPAGFSVTVFPIHSDGRVECPLSGQCLEVSAGGASVRTTAPLSTSYAYLAFEGVRGTTGLAILISVVRPPTRENGFVLAARYRLDMWPPPPS